MIINTVCPHDGKRYTDEKVESARVTLETILKAYVDGVVAEGGAGEAVLADVEALKNRVGEVSAELDGKADAVSVPEANSFSVVKVNSQGLVTSTSPLTAEGALGMTDGTLRHRTSGVAPGTYGDASHVLRVTVDAYGHVTSVTTVPAFAPSTAGTAGQVLRSDGTGYVPEDVATSVTEGGTGLVTAGAVYTAIRNTVADAHVYTVKGSCTYDTLVTMNGMSVGDVWNISSGMYAGANFVYTESGWDKLSETVDLSGYLLKSDADDRYALRNTYEAHVLNTTNAASAVSFGHARSADPDHLGSTDLPDERPVASVAGDTAGSVGSDDKEGVFARADHRHPAQESVEGYASRWKEARSVTLSGDATGAVSIDGTEDVTLEVTLSTEEGSALATIISDLESRIEEASADQSGVVDALKRILFEYDEVTHTYSDTLKSGVLPMEDVSQFHGVVDSVTALATLSAEGLAQSGDFAKVESTDGEGDGVYIYTGESWVNLSEKTALEWGAVTGDVSAQADVQAREVRALYLVSPAPLTPEQIEDAEMFDHSEFTSYHTCEMHRLVRAPVDVEMPVCSLKSVDVTGEDGSSATVTYYRDNHGVQYTVSTDVTFGYSDRPLADPTNRVEIVWGTVGETMSVVGVYDGMPLFATTSELTSAVPLMAVVSPY